MGSECRRKDSDLQETIMKDTKGTSRLLSEAIVIAADAYCGQTHKNEFPYIDHPLAVAEKVKDSGYGNE